MGVGVSVGVKVGNGVTVGVCVAPSGGVGVAVGAAAPMVTSYSRMGSWLARWGSWKSWMYPVVPEQADT